MSCERTTLAAIRLYQLVTKQKDKLSQFEKNRLTTDYLFVLAITNILELNQHDKCRLSPLHLAQLAVTEKIDLSQEDKDRLPVDLLFDLFAQGLAALTDQEMARFTREQRDYLKELGRTPIVIDRLVVPEASVCGQRVDAIMPVAGEVTGLELDAVQSAPALSAINRQTVAATARFRSR